MKDTTTGIIAIVVVAAVAFFAGRCSNRVGRFQMAVDGSAIVKMDTATGEAFVVGLSELDSGQEMWWKRFPSGDPNMIWIPIPSHEPFLSPK